jgi:tRNA dimethylallyltransferase
MNVILLKGPTAIGKTDLACAVYDIIPVTIISVDSAQIYKDMNIGTAKPDKNFLQKYPHHLIDIITPKDTYNVSNFIKDVDVLIKQAFKNNTLPLLVGGTSMYFKTLIDGISNLPKSCEKTRMSITQEAKKKGWDYVHTKLAKIDKIAANNIKQNDHKRIMRALEVYYLTGKNISYLRKKRKKLNYNWINLALVPENRTKLHQNINKRFLKMIRQGIIAETEYLVKKYNLTEDYPSLKTVGYKQTYQYLKNKINKKELIAKASAATRQMAKRQLTWLRSETNIHHISDKLSLKEQLVSLQKLLSSANLPDRYSRNKTIEF